MQNQLFKFVFLLIGLLSMPHFAYATTPSINDVTGAVATGQTLTITGTTMVDENKTNWGSAYQSGTKYGFEGTSFLSDGYAIAPDEGAQEREYDSEVKLMGGKSYRGRIYGDSGGLEPAYLNNHSAGLTNNASGDLADEGVGSSTDIYVRMYSRWHSSGTGDVWPNSHIKMLDIMGAIGGGENESGQLYMQPAPTDGELLPTDMAMTYDGARHDYAIANFLTDNRWYCIEARFKTTVPKRFTTWVDGVQISDTEPIDVIPEIQWVAFNMINANSFDDLDVTNWTDGFTISTSRVYPAAIIEISDNVIYGAGVVVKQEQLYLGDESVQIKADLTGLGTGPYYLFVTNNRQERSVAYDLSGSADTTPPANPNGLSVS